MDNMETQLVAQSQCQYTNRNKIQANYIDVLCKMII